MREKCMKTRKRLRGLIRLRHPVAAGVVALGMAAGATPAFAQSDPGTRVWEVGGSNMGECSAYLGGMGVRDDVNRIIRQFGDVLHIDNPGQIFHVRAQQAVSLPPAQECLKRTLPG